MAIFLIMYLFVAWNELQPSECMDGYIGNNCSFKCRYPSYGKGCQSECNCSAEKCDVFIGCAKVENDITGGREKFLGVHTTPIVISVPVIACVVFIAVLGRYFWRKYYVNKQTGNGKEENTEAKHIQELFRRRLHCPDDTNGNTYEENVDLKMDKRKGREDNTYAEEAFSDYADSLAFKREKISKNRESEHFYTPLG